MDLEQIYNQISALQASVLIILFTLVASVTYLEIRHSALRGIPGPLISRYTNAWRCYLAWIYSDRPGGITYHEVLHERYGNVVRVGPSTVFINDPAAIPVVLGFKDRLEKTDSVNAFMQPGKPTSIVGIRNEQKHAAYRRPIQGAYSLSSLKLYEPAINDMINKLVGIFAEKSKTKEIINVTEWCHFFAYDTIMNITFGSPLGFLENAKDMYDLIANQVKHVAYVRVLTQWPALDYLIRTNPVVVAFKKHKESPFFRFAVHRITEEMQKSPSDEIPKRTLLQHFVDAKSRYPDIVDDTQVRLYCATNSLAGSLSPSRVLDCVLSWLAQHPGQQDHLCEEILQNVKTFPVSLEEIPNIPYLEGVIREGYRLHHGGDIAIERKVGPNGLTLPDGRVIPAGYDVAMSSPSIRVCSVFGSEPHVFKPERWMKADEESVDAWKARRSAMERADLTFSQGSRACIGKSFTHLELFKVVATVLGQFKLELAGTPKRFVVPVKLSRRSGYLPRKSKDVYPGDRTPEAVLRLRAQHNVSKSALGGLVLAPIALRKPNLRILDCGAADGYWLYDLSNEVDSSATLVGTDIASFPTFFRKPENLAMFIQSYKDPWPATWKNSFDLVHMRFCVAGLANPEEARIAIDRLIELVKPGGWIQLVDSILPSGQLSDDDTASMKLLKSMAAMLRSKGQDTNAGLRIRSLLSNSGRLSNIESKDAMAKLGHGAPSPSLAEDGIFNLMKMIDTLKNKIDGLDHTLMTSLELEALRPQIEQEARKSGVEKPYFAAWGQRID